MRFDFPYPNYAGIAGFGVPEQNLMGLLSPKAFDGEDEA